MKIIKNFIVKYWLLNHFIYVSIANTTIF
jgi:hypothetical protein